VAVLGGPYEFVKDAVPVRPVQRACLAAEWASDASDTTVVVVDADRDELVHEQAFIGAQLGGFVRPALINGAAGAVIAAGGRVLAVMGFTVAHGKVVAIDVLTTPSAWPTSTSHSSTCDDQAASGSGRGRIPTVGIRPRPLCRRPGQVTYTAGGPR
jgi:hypothetical protein